MAAPVIKVEDLSKAYQIGQIGTSTLSKDVDRFVKTKILGKEDPYLKIGQTNDRSKKGDSNIVWSLKDINFEVNQGDAVGIIGKNGAGKSTLLKLLSRVTGPTTGSIKVKGRIASLLEVGTGFHPELTGKENVYLNGAILGMRKKEITRKLDEIIDFSGVERYIDTPVKRYSSGMYVRLAFAVAAHLESEILIVDEVLAVGDAEFQKKCLGKMGDISKGEGRTLLFVSHNMAAVQNLCNKGIVLKNGINTFNGNVKEAVSFYLNENIDTNDTRIFINSVAKLNGIKSVEILANSNSLKHSDRIKIQVNLINPIANCMVGIALLNSNKLKIFTTVYTAVNKIDKLICEMPSNLLLKGNFSLDVATFNDVVFDYVHDVCAFEIVDLVNDYKIYGSNSGDIKIECEWYEK